MTGNVTGTLMLSQVRRRARARRSDDAASSKKQNGASLSIVGSLVGLAAGKHGLHIHSWGDTRNSCLAAGTHFNPCVRARRVSSRAAD